MVIAVDGCRGGVSVVPPPVCPDAGPGSEGPELFCHGVDSTVLYVELRKRPCCPCQSISECRRAQELGRVAALLPSLCRSIVKELTHL